jgi:hypothetical protein
VLILADNFSSPPLFTEWAAIWRGCANSIIRVFCTASENETKLPQNDLIAHYKFMPHQVKGDCYFFIQNLFLAMACAKENIKNSSTRKRYFDDLLYRKCNNFSASLISISER